jgi:hypothetical protein
VPRLTTDVEESVSIDNTAEHETRYAVGTKVKKFFRGHGRFLGEIVSVSDDCYNIRYDDDDTEEFFFDEAGLDKIVACARGLSNSSEVCTAYRQKDSSIEIVIIGTSGMGPVGNSVHLIVREDLPDGNAQQGGVIMSRLATLGTYIFLKRRLFM